MHLPEAHWKSTGAHVGSIKKLTDVLKSNILNCKYEDSWNYHYDINTNGIHG